MHILCVVAAAMAVAGIDAAAQFASCNADGIDARYKKCHCDGHFVKIANDDARD